MEDLLSPADAAVALRSFPRRFRAMLQPPRDDRFDPDEVARRPGSTGWTAVQHLVTADGLMTQLWHALGERRHGAGAVIAAGMLDPSGFRADDPGTPLAELLDDLQDTAEVAASRVADLTAPEWAEPAPGADVGGRPATWLGLLHSVVDAVAGHLRASQRVLDEVR